MSNQDSNRTFTSNLLRLSLRNGIMPALALSMISGTAGAQDSGGFGLLAALKNQSQQDAQHEATNEALDELDQGMMFQGEPEFEENYPSDMHPAADEDLSNFNGEVDVSDYDLVDLHVNNESLGNILQLLSIQSSRNIISSNNVSASVTADLYGVTFYEALDSILHVNGYGYIEKGNFIYVYTSEELAEFEALSRQAVTKIITLDYLNATDAGEFAKMLLSESGSITTNAITEAFAITDGSPTGADTYASTATIVVHDFEENVEDIIDLIASLDTKPEQILVEATILQTSLNEANAFGMDFALIQNLDFNDFVGTGGPLSVVGGLISGQGEDVAGTAVNAAGGGHGSAVSSSVGNVSTGPSTLKAGFVNGDVGVFMRVLDDITDVTVVSNPKLLTLNRQPARVLVGTRVGYLNSTTTDTSTTQSVEFLDVGTQLSVRPFVSKNGLIRLELRPQVSSFTLRQVSDGAGNNVTIPDEETTEMNTNVMVRDGQTVVLGGLFTETTTASRRQVPVLGDIPLIGNAFKGYDDETRRSEIIFLITPSIVNDTVLAEAGDMGNQYIEHARYGARNSLLPWSRERRVGQLLIEAREQADNGMLVEALSKVDRALRLMPMSPDARALRTEITGAYQNSPSRSIMDGMLHNELHFGGKSTSVTSPNTINPFFNADPQSGVATGEDTNSIIEFDPSSDEDYQTDPALEGQPFAEVEVDTVSDASFSTDSSYDDGFFTERVDSPEFTADSSTSPIDSSEEFISGEGYTQVAIDEPFGNSVDSNTNEFDQMKSIVTGEQTALDTTAGTTTGTTDSTTGEWTSNTDGALDDTTDSASTETTFSVAAEKFGGQLIIPLPGGGALRLDWPLSFDYIANGSESADTESEATFTEVPGSSDDFTDLVD